jgi:hypothetical protein
MIPPAPVKPHVEPRPKGSSAVLLLGAQTTSRVVRTFGFQVLAVLLGIALAFM